MNKLYLIGLCFILNGCGAVAVDKPAIFWNAESDMDDAIEAYADEEWARSQQLFNRALSLYQSLDERGNVLACHINLVEVALAIHDTNAVTKHLNLAEAIVEIDQIKEYQLRVKFLYAMLAMQQNKIAEAEKLLNEILPDFQGDTAVTESSAIHIAAISSRTKIAFLQKKDQGLWTQRYAMSLKTKFDNNPHFQARLLRFQAKLFFQQGDNKQASVHLQQALLLYKNKLSRTGIAATLFELGDFYQQQSHWLQSLNYFERSIHVFKSLANTEKVAQINQKRILVQSKMGRQ